MSHFRSIDYLSIKVSESNPHFKVICPHKRGTTFKKKSQIDQYFSSNQYVLYTDNKLYTFTEPKGSICELPPDSGSCFHATLPRYYYNEETESCKIFYFSGCQGNENNFVSGEECKTKCKALSSKTNT